MPILNPGFEPRRLRHRKVYCGKLELCENELLLRSNDLFLDDIDLPRLVENDRQERTAVETRGLYARMFRV